MSNCVDPSDCIGKGSLCFYRGLNPFVSWFALTCSVLSYICIILALTRLMKSRKAVNARKILVFYNALQILLSVVMAVKLSPPLLNGVFNINGQFCPDIEFWIFIHYCSKHLDMFDTIFMLCRKRTEQLSFLHIYHHVTIGLIWGILLRNGLANGTAFWGAWINSTVHAFMYTHYLWTSFGFRNPMKFLLTKIQMFQFVLCILHAALVVIFDRHFSLQWSSLQMVYHLSLLVLFINFYRVSKKKN
ncbi:putative elongation of very long chain fatty acids protein [Trypanosoma vivax]|uniref:Elongation of fatty acids protein n=1 Tax=Trypanosoma vivax (strain Y486) TaxID=1055687 RepID=G0TV10_TRYVY|nr:putative elongation of very long chain fatty acids protein [Trypanosoma vivax]CCC48193.1 putative elongation of very long chain fatty acids protein [Trypanosoma vivax Y486]